MERRSIAAAIVFTIITFGIYAIYWKYKIAKGFYVTPSQSRVDTTPGVTVLLWLVTFGIYGWYCYYKWGQASAEIPASLGYGGEDKSVLYLVLAIVGFAIINDAIIQSDFNTWVTNMGGGRPPYQGQPPYQQY